MRFTFECSGQTLIDRELLRFGDRTVDVSPAFHVISDLMMDETKLQFATEGGHASGGWRPLKAATIKEKQRQGMRLQILQRTGALLDSLTVKGDANQVLEITPQTLTFGSRVPYADFHQTGTSHMPRRPPLAFTEPAKRAVLKVIQEWIVKGEVPR